MRSLARRDWFRRSQATREPKPAELYVPEYPRLGEAGRRRLEAAYHVVSEAAYGTSRLKIRVITMSRN